MSAALPGVITALVALFDAALDVPVFDGPIVTGDRPTGYLQVGSAVNGIPGTGTSTDEQSTFNLELSDMGPGTWEQETGEIPCAAVAWSGDTEIVAARTAAFALFETCRAALKGDRTIGGALPLNGVGLIGAGSLSQLHTTEGVVASVSFTVPYQTVLIT